MKTVLLTAAVNTPGWSAHTIPRLAVLAMHLKADFHCLISERHSATGPKYSRENFWLKTDAFEKVKGSYDRVIWIDGDVMPNFWQINRQDMRQLTECSQVALSIDPLRVITSEYMLWYKSSGLPITERVHGGCTYWNAGIMAMTSEFCHAYLTAMKSLRGHVPGKYQDQDFLNYFIHANRVTVCELPSEMNWMAAHHNLEAAVRKAKMIHLAGEQKHLAAPLGSMLPPH